MKVTLIMAAALLLSLAAFVAGHPKRKSRLKSGNFRPGLVIPSALPLGLNSTVLLKTKENSATRTTSIETLNWKPARNIRRPIPFDPRRTWQTFLRHSERTEAQSKKMMKAKQRLRSGGRYLPGPQGPQGPRGPRGPRGPAGANVTDEEMFEKFRDLVRDDIERRTQTLIDGKCEINCTAVAGDNETLNIPPLFNINTATIYPKIPIAFIWRLSTDTRVGKKTFMEIKKMNQPFMGGAFQRGETESAEEGRLNISKKGFYVFYVTLHILNRSPKTGNKTIGQGDVVTGLLCIDSVCQKNISLESTSLLELGRKFTITINGVLYLEVGQYVSIFVDNNSKFVVKVLSGSQFSGFLSGV